LLSIQVVLFYYVYHIYSLNVGVGIYVQIQFLNVQCICLSCVDAEFRNTGLERSESLKEDLEWFKENGHTIPEPSSPGLTYAQYLKELSVKDPQAFICHFYNIYFAHSAGGRMIGKKVNNYMHS